MSKAIVSRIDRNLARRLREARREVGYSTRKVEKLMDRTVRVSHSTIASYENGTTVPPVDVLGDLSRIYQRPMDWFLSNRQTLTDFTYRNLESRVPLQDQRKYAALAGKWAEAYFSLEKHLKVSRSSQSIEIDSQSSNEIAHVIRTQILNLDDGQPVVNTVSVLEMFQAWAIELKAEFRVDGAAACHGDRNVVVLNPTISNERARINTAYELASVLLPSKSKLATDFDKEAYSFASSLLMPDNQVKEAFKGKSFLRLIEYKQRFGVSLSAMIFRAEQLKIINTTASRWLRSEMVKRGWRQNEPGFVWRDRAISFEMLLESAIQTKAITWSEAERITSISKGELKERIDGVFAESNENDVDSPSILSIAKEL